MGTFLRPATLSLVAGSSAVGERALRITFTFPARLRAVCSFLIPPCWTRQVAASRLTTAAAPISSSSSAQMSFCDQSTSSAHNPCYEKVLHSLAANYRSAMDAWTASAEESRLWHPLRCCQHAECGRSKRATLRNRIGVLHQIRSIW